MIFTKLSPAKPTRVYDTYWRFAAERQAIFFRRFHGQSKPWTSDPILKEYKFTNAYRASDRVSQYLIKNVIYQGEQSPQEVFFRIILFKLFNRIGTWELLLSHLDSVLYAEYDFEKYNSILSKALSQGNPIYSGAYIMSSGKGYFGHKRKHTNHLRLIEMMMEEAVPQRVVAAKSMRKVFEILLSYPGLGDFLAYQFAVDINYSTLTDFSEMAFVVPGPGARDGIRKCFKDTGGLDDIDLIKLMADRQEAEFQRLGLTFQSLWGRPLQLIDCQNLFCEADKYARVAHPTARGVSGRTRIKQKYRTNEKPFEYWYPPKWRLNDLVKRPV